MDGTPATVIDQVFLTPRVLDARAFSEYSTTLQDLLKEAAGHQTSLHAVSTDMQSLHQSMRDAMADLQRKLDHAVKALPGIDVRVAKAEKLVSEAHQTLNVEPMERLRAMRLESSRVTFGALQEFQTQIADVLTAALEQSRLHTDALIARSSELHTSAASLATTFETRLQARLDDFARQAVEYHGILDTQARIYDDRLTRRGEELEAKMRAQAITAERIIDAKLSQLESRIMQFDTMVAATSERQAQAAIAAVIEQAAAVERRTNTVVADASAQVADLQESLDKNLRQAAATSQTVTAALTSLRDTSVPVLEKAQFQADGAADRLGVLLATARDFIESDQGGGAIREIRQLASRLETVRADSDFAARQFDEIRKQADLARTNLGQALVEAASGADLILSRSDEVIARTHQCGEVLQTLIVETARAEQLAEIAGNLTARSNDVESAAARLGEHIEALEVKKAQLETDLRRTGELLDIADISLAERYDRLGAAIQRGNELGVELQATTAQSLSSIEAARQEQSAAAQHILAAKDQLDRQIRDSISPLLAQSQAAAQRLESMIRRTESLEVRIPARTAQSGVSASTLFPTAR